MRGCGVESDVLAASEALEAALPHWPLVHCGWDQQNAPAAQASRGKGKGKESVLEGIDDSQGTREVNAGGLLVPAILFAAAGFSPGCERIEIFLFCNGSILARSAFRLREAQIRPRRARVFVCVFIGRIESGSISESREHEAE